MHKLIWGGMAATLLFSAAAHAQDKLPPQLEPALAGYYDCLRRAKPADWTETWVVHERICNSQVTLSWAEVQHWKACFTLHAKYEVMGLDAEPGKEPEWYELVLHCGDQLFSLGILKTGQGMFVTGISRMEP